MIKNSIEIDKKATTNELAAKPQEKSSVYDYLLFAEE